MKRSVCVFADQTFKGFIFGVTACGWETLCVMSWSSDIVSEGIYPTNQSNDQSVRLSAFRLDRISHYSPGEVIQTVWSPTKLNLWRVFLWESISVFSPLAWASLCCFLALLPLCVSIVTLAKIQTAGRALWRALHRQDERFPPGNCSFQATDKCDF